MDILGFLALLFLIVGFTYIFGTTIPLGNAQSEQTNEVVLVGDVNRTAVVDSIRNHDPDYVIVLGDLGYQQNLSWFKEQYVDKFGKKLKCILGNHDTIESGPLSLENEAIELCENSWSLKVDNSLFLGFNSEGDLHYQLNDVQVLLSDKEYMKNVNNIHVLTHKNCVIQLDPLISKSKLHNFCTILKSMIPTNIEIDFIAAHNHIMSYTNDSDGNHVFVTGAGGDGHHKCLYPLWKWCDDKFYGYLELSIGKNRVESTFYDTNGNMLYKVDRKKT